jgi:hypothetical protein
LRKSNTKISIFSPLFVLQGKTTYIHKFLYIKSKDPESGSAIRIRIQESIIGGFETLLQNIAATLQSSAAMHLSLPIMKIEVNGTARWKGSR